MTVGWFKRKLANGKGGEVYRSWLVYSPLKQAAYCFCCLLFAKGSLSSFPSEVGFSKWKRSEKLLAHETSPGHRHSFTVWKEAEWRACHQKGIECELETQIQSEKR